MVDQKNQRISFIEKNLTLVGMEGDSLRRHEK